MPCPPPPSHILGFDLQRGAAAQTVDEASPLLILLQLEAAVEHKGTKRVIFYEHLLLHSVMTMG